MITSIWPIRSFLFIPAHKRNWVTKATLVMPDAVVLDLEDSVPLDMKSLAREFLSSEIFELSQHQIAPFVRIHQFNSNTSEEIEAVVHEGLQGIMLPKADSANQIRLLHDLLSYYEGLRGLKHGVISILPLPETARGLQDAESLASASPRVRGIVGTVSGPVSADVAQAFGFRASMGGVEQYFMNSKLVLDSRAGGANYPIAGVFGVPLNDLAAVETLLRRARDFGYTGSPVMHPSHVAIANEVYSPTKEEFDYHEGLLKAFAQAEKNGSAAIQYQGSMIDYAMLPQSKQIISEYHRRKLINKTNV